MSLLSWGLRVAPIAAALAALTIGFFMARRTGGRALEPRWRVAEVLAVFGVLAILQGTADAAYRIAEGTAIGVAPSSSIMAGSFWLMLAFPILRRRRS